MQDDFRKKLIADHMEMAAAIASECVTKFNLFSLLPYADVLGYAQQGLVEAANRYSPESGTKFRSYSWSRIRGAVIDGVRKCSRHGFSRTLGAPTYEPADGPAPKAKPQELDAIADEKSVQGSAEDDVDASRLRAVLLRAIEALPARQRDVTLRHYYRGQDLVDISEQDGLSEDYVGRIHATSLRQLRAALGETLRDYVSAEAPQ